MPNQFCWYELMTPDVGAAKDFYGDVLGWTAETMGSEEQSYTILSVGDRGVAGVLEKPERDEQSAREPVWLGYIAVNDCDEAAARISAAGGCVHRPPTDIPDIGRFAVVADPQGAIFYIMQPFPTDAPPPLPTYTPGTAGWRELYAANWEKAFDFYSDQFGWTKDQAMDMGPMGTYQLFAAGGDAIGGMMNKPDCFPRPFWLYTFCVDDIDAAAERVIARGGEILNGPCEVPGCVWALQAKDDGGAMFGLVGPRSKATHQGGEA